MIDENFVCHIFQHAQKNLTNKTNCNGRKRSQTHIYELHNDGRGTQCHTYGNKFDVGNCSSMCEGAFRE